MKISKYILASMLVAAAAVGITSCDNDLDYPPVIVPEGGLGEGTPKVPLTVNGVRAYYQTYYSEVPDESKVYWVTGYIVGCATTTQTVFVANENTSTFEAPFGSATNILLAASPTETDYSKCIAMQLPSGKVRTDLNLKDNPSNLGKQVSLHGYISKYLGLAGMRSIDEYNWGEFGIDAPEPAPYHKVTSISSGKGYGFVVDNAGSLSIAKPADQGANYGYLYSAPVTDSEGTIMALDSYAFMFTESATAGQYYIVDSYGRYLYMQGTYTSFQLSSTLAQGDNNYLWIPFCNEDGTWTITNAGNTKVMQYYVDKVSFGAYATIQDGYLLPMLYELEGDMTIPEPDPTPGPTPGPAPEPTPGEAGVIYTALGEADAALTEGWSFDDISLSGDLTYVWSWKEYSGAHYLNASAYLGGANAAQADAVSGVISLAGAKDCTVSFDHAAKFQTTLRDGCTIMVREAGTTEWTLLTIPVWPTAGSWAFVNSDEISLSQFDGKEIQLAFRYVSTSAGADTWEIKNLKVKGTK